MNPKKLIDLDWSSVKGELKDLNQPTEGNEMESKKQPCLDCGEENEGEDNCPSCGC